MRYWETAFEMQSGYVFDSAVEELETLRESSSVEFRDRGSLIREAQAEGLDTLEHVLRKGRRYHLQLLDAAGLNDTA
jgi:hypothetical protein